MPSFLQVERYESGVPVQTAGDRITQTVQPLIVVLFAVLVLVFVRPMAIVDGTVTAGGLVRLLLTAGCAALLSTVTVPERFIKEAFRVGIALTAAVLAGVLLGLNGQGPASLFAYMVAVHCGYRFPMRTAVGIVAVCVTVALAVFLTPWANTVSPWWTNLIVVAALVPGITRRARQMTFAAANEAVIQSRRAAASEAQSRAMAERASIARDIHDVLAHSLSGVNMQLSLADALLDSGDTVAGREAVRSAQRLVVEGLQEARSAMYALRGDTIDAPESIERMISGPGETFTLDGEPQHIPSRTVHTLVRVAQESLTNARRHAPGAPVDIVLAYRPEAVRLTVTNAAPTGTEKAENRTEGSGLGLVGIRERVAQLDGQAEIGPHESGWQVRVDIPLGNDQAEEQA